MIIQINTDKNVTVHDTYYNKLNELLTSELKRFSPTITRVELFLSDENGPKKGIDEKKCALETRLAGRKPLAVSGNGATYDLAVKAALIKMKTVLDTTMGKK